MAYPKRGLGLSAALALCATTLFAQDRPPDAPQEPRELCADRCAPAQTAGNRQLWADSRLFTDAPLPEMRAWLPAKPETADKFLVVEFWRTWCGACKRLTPLMNALQKKYGRELVVIGVTGEEEAAVRAYAGPAKEYALALDPLRKPEPDKTNAEPPHAQNEAAPELARGAHAPPQGQGRYEASFGVWGWPHVVILEPRHRTVIWEGFPGQKGFELTEAKVEKILAVERALRQQEEKNKPPQMADSPLSTPPADGRQ